MNTFYRHLQPNISKFSDHEELPEDLRCHYAINYNVWGIDYFFDNYLLQESTDGIYLLLNENSYNFILEDSLNDHTVIDIPRLYILITKEFLSDSSKFQEFIMKAAKDNEIYGLGIDGFRPGKDYYINNTLFNYLANFVEKKEERNDEEDIDSNGDEEVYGAKHRTLIVKKKHHKHHHNGENREDEEEEEIPVIEQIDPEFYFSVEQCEVELGRSDNEYPVLTKSEGVEGEKYFSSDINVARVDINTGKVTILKEGETTIVCMFEGNEQYYGAQCSYDLKVKEQVIDPYESLNTEFELPNYIDEKANITEYFIDLDDQVIRDYTNLEYFEKKNSLLDLTFNEDELNNFYQGICRIILAYSSIQNNSEVFNKQNNQIYDKVLNYFANSKVDDASIMLNLILGSSYTNNNVSQNVSCGCSTSINGNGGSIVNESCAVLYEKAMPLYLTQMFGDAEFYEDWFNIYLSEDEIVPNDVLIETLQLFIKEFIILDYNLDQELNKASYQCNCNDKQSLNNSSLEYKKINNFLQILEWVNNSEIDANTNKIKIYGEAFGELLPKLQF